MSAPSEIGRVITYEPYHWKDSHRVRDFSLGDPTEPISFHHPGYADNNTLIQLEPFDQSSDGKWGVHYGFAFTACTIIACNKPGYLVEGSPDGERVAHDWDSVLSGSEFFFHVDNPTNGPYPICPTFQDWEMPSTLPPEWVVPRPSYIKHALVTASDMKIGVRARDGHCTMTQSIVALEVAYVIPKAELKWFSRNSMARYAQNPQLSVQEAMNDVRNGLLLRSDRRGSWDDRFFVLFPKNGSMVTHVLVNMEELWSLHHNVQPNIARDLPLEFYYARFAYTIIPMLRRLFLDNTKRVVKVYTEATSKYQIVEHPYRTKTPEKRKRAEIDSPRPVNDHSRAPGEEAGYLDASSSQSSEESEGGDFSLNPGLSRSPSEGPDAPENAAAEIRAGV